MELNKMRELIQKAKAAAQTEDFRQLVDNFEGFIELFNQKEDRENPEFLLKLDQSHRKFWGSFEKVATSLGITSDHLKDYFENPNNFSPEQWQAVQAHKQEIVGEQKASPKKFRKNNHKMRI